MFTEKTPAIVDVMQMITGKPRIDGECVFDGSDLESDVHGLEFRDERSRREYEISGMCQDCQDGVFG